MRLGAIVFVLCCARLASAEDAAEPASEPLCLTPPTLLPHPTRECATGISPGMRVARVAVELVLGGGLGALSEVTGAFIGLSVDVAAGREAGAGLGIGTAVGAALGVAPGVWLGGYAMGGDG